MTDNRATTPPNPYAPPRSTSVLQSTAPRARKPIGAWLLQLVCVFIILSLLSTLVRMLPWAMELVWQRDRGIRGLLRIAAVGFSAAALWGAEQRTGLGRALGLLYIGLIFVVFAVVAVDTYQGPAFTLSKQFLTESVGHLMVPVCILTAIASWFCDFGFTAKARAYFQVGRKTEDVP